MNVLKHPATYTPHLASTVASGDEPPHDGGMDGFDRRLRAVEQDVAAIKASMATKADITDLYKAINGQTWKIISALIALAAVVVASAKFIR